jgi:hypothetical protein
MCILFQITSISFIQFNIFNSLTHTADRTGSAWIRSSLEVQPRFRDGEWKLNDHLRALPEYIFPGEPIQIQFRVDNLEAPL